MIRHIILHSPTAYREPATVAQATTDDQVVALCLHAPSRHTQRAYLADVDRFRALSGKQLHQVTLAEVRDVEERGNAGQISGAGKGGRTRAVLLSAATWTEVAALRDGECPDAQLFRSRKGGRLDESQVVRIVRAAGKRADIADIVSPHWL